MTDRTPKPIDPDQLLNTSQAARLLNVKPNTLAKWRAGYGADGPRFVKIGRKVCYRRTDLQAFIDARTFENTAQSWAAGTRRNGSGGFG